MAEFIPSERELEILKALWELGSASVRQVHDLLCPDGELCAGAGEGFLEALTIGLDLVESFADPRFGKAVLDRKIDQSLFREVEPGELLSGVCSRFGGDLLFLSQGLSEQVADFVGESGRYRRSPRARS